MRRIQAIAVLLVCSTWASAQTDLVSVGGEGTGSGGTMSFSIGQVFYTETSGSGKSRSEGVQQGEDYGLMWVGATSTDWSVGSNWSKGVVPSASDSAIITAYPTNQPHITTDLSSPTEIDNINIRSGASLTVDAGNGLTVFEQLYNDGTMLIKADASSIGSLLTEGSINGSGSFQMEQYLQGSGGGTPNGLFFYVGSPVADAQASTFNIASGNKLWSADETSTSYPQITNGSTVLDPMTGYVARMGSNGIVTYGGSAYNTGNFSETNITRTGTTDNNRGYNLLSNPYPSTVSWDDATKSNISTTLWYRTHQGTTMLYDTYNATSMVGTNNNGNGAVNGDIPPTQAFWVRVPTDGLTGSLSFTDAMRSHAGWSSIYRMAAEEGTVRMTLSNGNVSDETIILFNSDAQNGFDDYDSHKFWAAASVPQLYTTTGTDSLVINGLESVATNPVVDLGVKLPTTGNYSLTATEITLANEVWLEDRLLNIFQDLNLDNTYDFTDEAGNIPTRFALHFGMSITDIRSNDAFRAQVFSSGNEVNIILSEAANGTATVYDLAGKLIATENIRSVRTAFPVNSATGIYIVKLESDKGTSTHKVHLR
ncbi:MAG: T9SS type A sorting domain-containing protein [Flavobacteriales bacterium]|nr:T9SS type A sorting domain-containing protein [Flavobacteriales bacterium]